MPNKRKSIVYRLTRKALEEVDAEAADIGGECEICAASDTVVYRIREHEALLNKFEEQTGELFLEQGPSGDYFLAPALKKEWQEFASDDGNCMFLCAECRADYRKARRTVDKEYALPTNAVLSELEMTKLAYEAGFKRSDLMSMGLILFNYTRAVEKFHNVKGIK